MSESVIFKLCRWAGYLYRIEWSDPSRYWLLDLTDGSRHWVDKSEVQILDEKKEYPRWWDG